MANPKQRERGGRWLLYAAGGVMLLVGALLVFLPLALRLTAVHWLAGQGIEASIDKVRLGYADATLDVVGARGKNASGDGFRVDHLHLDLAWLPFFDRKISIEELSVSGLQVDIVRQGDVVVSMGGLAMPSGPGPATTGTAAPAWGAALQKLELADSGACYRREDVKQHLCLHVDSFNWRGPIAFDGNAEKALTAHGDIAVKSLQVMDELHQRTVLSVESLEMDSADLGSPRDLSVAKFVVGPVDVYPDVAQSRALAGFGRLEIDGVVVASNVGRVERVTLDGLAAEILRRQDGGWEVSDVVAQLLPTDAAPRPSAPAAEKEGAPLTLQIATVQVSKGGAIHFVDESLPTPFEVSARIDDLGVQQIDTGNPAQQSKVSLKLGTDQYGSIGLSGEAQLMSGKTFDLQGDAKGIDLRPVSAYIEQALGYHIKSGQLNAGLKLRANSGKLDSDLDLDFRHFEVEQPKTSGKAAVDPDLGLPLGSALNLLRDSDDSIHLSVPVTGDVDSPVFDPSDAIRKAVAKAISVAVVNYYTPFGLLTAVKGIYSLATALRFEPATFEPGTDKLTSASAKQLEKIQTMMGQRPALQLSLCGVSNASDLAVLAPPPQSQATSSAPDAAKPEEGPAPDVLKQLKMLAQQREDAVKGALVKQGIGADRLIECAPEYQDGGVAGVAISI